MKLRCLAAALAVLGAAACGGGTTLAVQPAAAVQSPPGATAPAPAGCDAGRWTGAIDPEGRPQGLDAGDAGAVYVWHDGDGWHLRSTDRRPTDHHYTGTIRLEPAGAAFSAVRTVRDESHDRVSVDGSNTLHYDFHTFASIDGVDLRVSCPAERGERREHERLSFHTQFDGQPVADRVRIGRQQQVPKSAEFSFVRSV